jgi:hypothetical protein
VLVPSELRALVPPVLRSLAAPVPAVVQPVEAATMPSTSAMRRLPAQQEASEAASPASAATGQPRQAPASAQAGRLGPARSDK